MKLYLSNISDHEQASDNTGDWFRANLLIACDFKLFITRSDGYIPMARLIPECNMNAWNNTGTLQTCQKNKLILKTESKFDEIIEVANETGIVFMSNENGVVIRSACVNELRKAKMKWT